MGALMYFSMRGHPIPIALFAFVNLAGWWYFSVFKEVPEPYLDEFFHIPQAQRYCRGDYTWDPKITTPPGLYLVSRLLKPLLGCEIPALRLLNSISLCAIVPLSYAILRTQRARQTSFEDGRQDGKLSNWQYYKRNSTQILDAHSAMNIGLFPPLFFFAALYYTDILSTILVLCAYASCLRGELKSRNLFGMALNTMIGFVALWFRQTNIFWVAIFPAGLDVIKALKNDSVSIACPREGDVHEILREIWKTGTIYDCTVQDATPQDYVLFVLSLLMAIAKKPIIAIRASIQYLSLVAVFSAFVVWNGSVVLGDKSAHTATIHIPQMLYIWPYIAFFSLPLLIGPVLRLFVSFLPATFQSVCKEGLNAHGVVVLPKPLVSMILMTIGFIAVRYNTIIHPYTLADNRHYVFYVFRIFRQHPAMKYLAVPVYYVCSWLTLQALASPSHGKKGPKSKTESKLTSNETDSRLPISFITIWMVTTALSVITAPLVEPRYFILPWILWRLHVPYTPAALSRTASNSRRAYDKRLVMESVWLLAINAAVCYMFLSHTFSWPSEPGKKQRFIW